MDLALVYTSPHDNIIFFNFVHHVMNGSTEKEKKHKHKHKNTNIINNTVDDRTDRVTVR